MRQSWYKILFKGQLKWVQFNIHEVETEIRKGRMKRKNENKKTVGDRTKSSRNKVKERRAATETSVSHL